MNQFKSTKYIMITTGFLVCLFFANNLFLRLPEKVLRWGILYQIPLKTNFDQIKSKIEKNDWKITYCSSK